MFARLAALPIIVVLLDIWFGLGWNVFQSLNNAHTPAPDILTTVPEVAFNWLQVMVNASMVITITLSLVVLLQLNQAMSQGKLYVLGPFRILGLFLILAFSLPALYGFSMAVWQLLQGHWVISLDNFRYLITALSMVACAIICLWRVLFWWRSYKQSQKIAT